MITEQQATSRLIVIMGATKKLAELIEGKAIEPVIATQRDLVANYEAEWMPGVKEVIVNADQQIAKYVRGES